jgi:hypothetical protein
MTIIFAAFTLPVNPPGVIPTLTLEHVWAALELKCRQPQLFLAVIKTCHVLEDDGGLSCEKSSLGMAAASEGLQ